MATKEIKPVMIGKHFDVVVVGAGFGGVYAIHALREKGISVCGFEAGDDVGGTWYWNRYPGARCDIESREYSYSFSEEIQKNWKWSHRYADQPEILAYINYVAETLDLKKDIKFQTRIVDAIFDEKNKIWAISSDKGDKITAQHVIMATGCLSIPKATEFSGTDKFKGKLFHTAYWPKDKVDFAGKKVGIIGTGSSGVQAIPLIAKEAKELYVFQRTPNFVVPAHNRILSDKDREEYQQGYEELRKLEWNSFAGIAGMAPETRLAMEVSKEEREKEFEARWAFGGLVFYGSFPDLLIDPTANEEAAIFARAKIKKRVNNPEIAELLTPKGYPFGTKRICSDTNYFEAFNRDNVHLIDVKKSPIKGIIESGVETETDKYDLDYLILATGFDALTGAVCGINVRGVNNASLKDKWSNGPVTHLGIMTAGFPNMYMTTGPGSPSVLFNMVLQNEYHIDWIIKAIKFIEKNNFKSISTTVEQEKKWTQLVDDIGGQTLFTKSNSWYMGSNVPGKARKILLYLGGWPAYDKICNEVIESNYKDYEFS
jgi:cyclohexanone monooxygenase